MSNELRRGDNSGRFTADDYNAIVRRIESVEQLRVAAPLELHRSGKVRNISLAGGTGGFYAKLSGTSSPYSWTEQIPQPGLTWKTGGRSGTANAYEVNAVSGLNNERDFLIPDGLGDYRFQFLREGENPPPPMPCARICVVAKICGVLKPGCNVVIMYGGMNIAGSPCVTDFSGQCCVNVGHAGPYVITVTVPDGTVPAWPVATYNLNAAKCTAYTLTVEFADPAFWLCTCPNLHPKPIRRTLLFNDGLGPTIPMDNPDFNAGVGTWGTGCCTHRTGLGYNNTCSDIGSPRHTVAPQVFWSINCISGTDNFGLSIDYQSCDGADGGTGYLRNNVNPNIIPLRGHGDTLLTNIQEKPIVVIGSIPTITYNFTIPPATPDPADDLYLGLRAIYGTTLNATVKDSLGTTPAKWSVSSTAIAGDSCDCTHNCDYVTLIRIITHSPCYIGCYVGDVAFTVRMGATVVASGITQAGVDCTGAGPNGTWTGFLPLGTVTISFSHPRILYPDLTTTIESNCISPDTASDIHILSSGEAPGYHCCGSLCVLPLHDTLFLTDTYRGGFILNWTDTTCTNIEGDFISCWYSFNSSIPYPGCVVGITNRTPSVGWDHVPTVSFAGGGGGTGATLSASVTDGVLSLTLTACGTGYTMNPNIVIDGHTLMHDDPTAAFYAGACPPREVDCAFALRCLSPGLSAPAQLLFGYYTIPPGGDVTVGGCPGNIADGGSFVSGLVGDMISLTCPEDGSLMIQFDCISGACTYALFPALIGVDCQTITE